MDSIIDLIETSKTLGVLLLAINSMVLNGKGPACFEGLGLISSTIPGSRLFQKVIVV